MTKPFLTYDEQIEKLVKEKHLQIADPAFAKTILRDIGYFTLIGGYKTPFINPMTRIYQNNTVFEDVFALYRFDLSLRELVFKYLCKIECKIRQLVSYTFCSKQGEQQSAYLDPGNYNNSRKNSSDISYLIQILSYNANRNKEFPNINEKGLEKYLKILTLFRNVCAHNERLYSFRIQIDFPDTVLHAKLGIPKKGSQYLLGKRDLFGLFIAFCYLLPKQDFLQFKCSFIRILNKYTKSSHQISEVTLLNIMGFPSNWKAITKYHI